MPLSRRMAAFNKVVTNRITGPLAPHLPGFGIVMHRGRKSGALHRSPVNAFLQPDGTWLFALTYGSGAQWVRNVLAAGGCELTSRGRTVTLTNPRLYCDPGLGGMPPVVRTILRLNHVDEFLRLDVAPG
jgi:deazaflavin-dependent oxidoreductase (nitroreductase family)